MQSVLIVVHLLVVITLVAVILLQRSEGGALGVGSTSGFMTGRGQANALTRATAILAAMFFLTSIGLTLMARLNQAPEVIEQNFTPVEPKGAAKEGAGKGNLLEQLQKMENQGQPELPPGVALPGGERPAEPSTAPSILEQEETPKGPSLALPALPNNALPPAEAPATPPPASKAYKPELPPALPPTK
ncbi:MAG TPA: preprotein translocase subunit SecG [Methylocella sp.]|nr:preprotein translocase subunit SecG [Methylocella sp.]